MLRAPRRSTLLSLLLLAALVTACGREPGPPSVDPSSLRQLPGGKVLGFTGLYGSHVWLGLPYAAAPVGEGRWRAPQPPARWEGVRESLATGEACPQYASVFAGEGRGAKGIIGDEDCLFLDVYAPRFGPGEMPSGDARLPVLLWIHGGGNSIGRAGFYDGGNLAATHDVVVVAINYRLGPFGWFRHEALRRDAGALDRSGNFGTLDQIRALEWVRDNAAAFGGDPGNVTIFGESAGGRNVLALVVSPLSAGLFHRAMVQSGGFGTSSAEEAENFADGSSPGHPHSSNEILARMLVRGGTAADRGAAKARVASMPDRAVEAYLRGKSHAEILAAYADDPYSFQGMLGFPQMFPDGVVLPEETMTERLAKGAYHRVPLILGTNRDENKMFMAFDPQLAHWRFGLLPQPRDAAGYEAHSDALARAWKARSVDGLARLARAAQGPSVYAYRWDWDEEPRLPFLYDGPEMLGAAHGLEVAFFFGHFDVGPDTRLVFGGGSREGRELLSGQMMSYLAQFAYAGSPGRGRGGDLPEWRAWDDSSTDAPRYVVLDTPADGGVRMASETYTVERVTAEAVADTRFPNARSRCALLRELAEWDYLSREQYAGVGGGACSGFAYEAYPWPDVAAE